MNTQQGLFTDLPRGEQLAALRKLKLPTHTCKSGKVSGAVQKSVLKVIDDHQGDRACFVSQDTIAEETGYGVSTIRRAIAALISQDLITKERPNHWSPNHHRINWTELTRVALGSSEPPTVHHEPSSVHTSTPERSHKHVRAFTEASPLVHHEPRNAPRNANLNDHLTAPWLAVVATMKRWGLISAQAACQAAKARGLSVEYVAELFHEAGGDREPQRWEPGQLANWLTGIKPPPFDESEAIRRRKERHEGTQQRLQARDNSKVAAIRRRARFDAKGRDVGEDAILAVTFNRLRRAGLERLATDEERNAGEAMALARMR